ncbi:MAG: D-2-hydroxyacid dehydrogenase [Halanaerobium sp.]
MKIVVLDSCGLNPEELSWSEIEKYGELEIYKRTEEENILERAKDAEIILTNKTPISRDTINKLDSLEYIGVLATGYNVIDLEAAAENGIVVTNVPAYSTDSVAQFVFALLLEVAHHVGEHNSAVKAGEWSSAKDFSFWKYPLIELKNKTMGIIGYGSIGQRTAELALAFGMNVIVHDRSPEKKKKDPSIMTDKIRFVDSEELFRNSDVISLHCPLTEETKGIINKESIDLMKEGVIIVNTARGPLIVEEDLAAALESGKIYAAAVDVLSNEPPKENNPIIKSDKTIITPHIAWAAKESRERLMKTVVDNIKSYLKGEVKNSIV